jgi:hypothetical protein
MFTMSLDIPADVPLVSVSTTENRGLTAEELAEQCAKNLISVSDTAPEEIRMQAHAFQKQIEGVVANFMRQAIRSDRTTVYNALKDAGHPELAELIRRL